MMTKKTVDEINNEMTDEINDEQREYLSPAEVAKLAGVSYGTVKRALELGELAAYRIGRRFFVEKTTAEEFALHKGSHARDDGYTIRQLMSKLSLSYAYISELVKSGELKSHKVGRQYIISEQDFQEFMQTKKLAPKSTEDADE